MDTIHQAHLERILANRKRRGVSVYKSPQRSRSHSMSITTQTEEGIVRGRYDDAQTSTTSPTVAGLQSTQRPTASGSVAVSNTMNSKSMYGTGSADTGKYIIGSHSEVDRDQQRLETKRYFENTTIASPPLPTGGNYQRLGPSNENNDSPFYFSPSNDKVSPAVHQPTVGASGRIISPAFNAASLQYSRPASDDVEEGAYEERNQPPPPPSAPSPSSLVDISRPPPQQKSYFVESSNTSTRNPVAQENYAGGGYTRGSTYNPSANEPLAATNPPSASPVRGASLASGIRDARYASATRSHSAAAESSFSHQNNQSHSLPGINATTTTGAGGGVGRGRSMSLNFADGNALFSKGIFDNFRNNPVLISTNIRPYRNTNTTAPSGASNRYPSPATREAAASRTALGGLVHTPRGPANASSSQSNVTHNSHLAATQNNSAAALSDTDLARQWRSVGGAGVENNEDDMEFSHPPQGPPPHSSLVSSDFPPKMQAAGFMAAPNPNPAITLLMQPATDQNPFRVQSFADFAVNPDYRLPDGVLRPKDLIKQRFGGSVSNTNTTGSNEKVLGFGDINSINGFDGSPNRSVSPKPAQNPGGALNSPRQGAAATVPSSSAPLYNFGAAIKVLEEGDWFLKWSRHGDVAKRYFAVDTFNGNLWWCKGKDHFFGKSLIHLNDIVSLKPMAIIDERGGDGGVDRTIYKVHIVTKKRFLHLGTEIKDKFDVWFDTLKRLVDDTQRQSNEAVHAQLQGQRVSTTKPSDRAILRHMNTQEFYGKGDE